MNYAQTLIDDFSGLAKNPHIAVSVDMLDTGIDVPEVVNLVFFKIVRSKTKFWQMVGRGTRLCRDLFGPGKHKQFFYILDYCGNLEYFGESPEATEGALAEPLGRQLFRARLELVAELAAQAPKPGRVAERARAGQELGALRDRLISSLRQEVQAMNPANFVVRHKRRYVEKYVQPSAWKDLGPDDLHDLAEHVAGLPSELPSEQEESKRFGLLMLRAQLAVLRSDPGFAPVCEHLKTIAGLLRDKGAIPAVRRNRIPPYTPISAFTHQGPE